MQPPKSETFRVAPIAWGAALLLLGGCGPGNEASSEFGPQGGLLTLSSGLMLEVPQGALRQSTRVTLRETAHDRFSAIAIAPADVLLVAPVMLRWLDDAHGELESDTGGLLAVERSGLRASARLHHFGHFRRWSGCGGDGGADGGCARPSRSCVDGGACSRDGGAGHHHGGDCSGGHDEDDDDDDGDDDSDRGCRADGGRCEAQPHCSGDGGCACRHHDDEDDDHDGHHDEDDEDDDHGSCGRDGGGPVTSRDGGVPVIP